MHIPLHHRSFVSWALAGLAIAAAFTPAARGQGVYKWTGAANNNWNNAGNWDTNAPYLGVLGNGAADIILDASLLDLTANRTLNLNGGTSSFDRTVGTFRLGDTNAVDATTYNWTVGANGAAGSSPKLILAVTAGAGTIEVVNGSATINPVLAGTSGLLKSGAGTLVLNNTANTLSGGIFLNAGGLTFVAGALGNNLIKTGGNVTLTWSGGTSDLSSQLSLGDGFMLTLAVSGNAGDNTIFATALQTGPLGTGGIVKSNAGHLTISAANTFTGGTRVNNGRLILIGGENRLSAAGALTLGNGVNSGVVQLGDASGASNQTVTNLALSGSGTANAIVGGSSSASVFTINNAGTITAANAPVFGGVGENENNLALVKTGAGTLTLSKTSTFSGGVNLAGGRLTLSSAAALGSGTKMVTISGTTNAPSLQLNQASGLALPASFSFLTSNDDATAPAIVNTAGVNVIQGNLTLASGGFGGGQTRILASGGSLVLAGAIAPAGDAASDRTLILDSAAGTASVATGLLSDTGTIKLGVAKEGAGTWHLSGANTFSGPLVVNSGRLNITTAHHGTGAISLASGTTLGLTLSAAGQSLNPASLNLGGTFAFDLGSFSNPVGTVVQTAVLTIATGSNITVAGTALHVGSFPLLQYTGTIGGDGFAGLPSGNLPSTAVPARVTANLIDDAANGKILLNVSQFDVPKWTGLNSNVWDINDGADPTTGTGTVNWKEAAGGTPTRYLQTGSTVDSVIFDDTAGVANDVVLGDSLAPTSVTVNSSSNAFVFSGVGRLTGATTLLKQGTSTLTLLNSGGNDFTGVTTIAAGTLQVGDGATTGGGQLGAGPIVNNATLRLNRADDFTVANLISGPGRLEKQAAGQVTISGNNSAFSGPIIVSAGFLKVGSTNALGDATGDTTVEAGAELNITGFSLAEPVKLTGGTLSSLSGTASTLSSPLTVSGGARAAVLAGTLTLSGAISGTGGLVKTDNGTLALAGTSTFSGGLTVDAGTVLVTKDQAYTGGTTILLGTVQIGTANGQSTTGSLGAGTILLAPESGPAALNILRADDGLLVANVIASSGAGTNSVSIGVNGASSPSGIVTFSGANTFSGNVAIHGGALKITDSSALGLGPKTVSIASSAGPALLLDGSGGNLMLAPEISYTASSDGTVVNNAANAGAIVNLAGNNMIQGRISVVNASGGNGRISAQGGTLTLAGAINADGATGARTLLLGGPAGGTVSGTITDGETSGAARVLGVTKDGSGTWNLTGLNTFTGAVAVQAGTVKVNLIDGAGAAQPLGKGISAITLGTATSGAMLEYTGAADAVLVRPLTVTASGPGSVLRNSGGGLLTLSGAIAKNGTNLTLQGGRFVVSGIISGAAANSNVIIDGAAVAFDAVNAYNGSTVVRGGSTLKLGVNNALPAGTILALGQSTFDLHGLNATIGGFANTEGSKRITNSGSSASLLTVAGGGTFDGVIEDGALASTGITKGGSGVLTLSGDQTYTGQTTVTGGTLVVAGELTSSSVRVAGGALELGRSDVLADSAALELAGGAFHTNGFSESGLGSLSISAGSTLDFGTGARSSLLFAGLGAHTAGALLTITNWSGTPNTIGSSLDDRLLFTGSLTDFENSFAQSDVTINGLAGYAALPYDATHYEITAVPEPGTLSTAIVAALLGFGMRRGTRLRRNDRSRELGRRAR